MAKKMNRFVYNLAKIILCCIIIFISSALVANALTLMLDPGHGGTSSGCTCVRGGKTICEKDLNLKIAKYLKKELEKYTDKKGKKIKVYLTHNGRTLTISQRMQAASDKKADAMISIHNNSHGKSSIQKGGCMVLVTNSDCNKLFSKEEKLATSIIKELNKTGVPTAGFGNNRSSLKRTAKKGTSLHNGLFRKLSDDGTKYPGGDTTDWYRLIREGVLRKIPSILIEHAYMSVNSDYNNFLSSDKKLESLAKADARGIASFYKLKLH